MSKFGRDVPNRRSIRARVAAVAVVARRAPRVVLGAPRLAVVVAVRRPVRVLVRRRRGVAAPRLLRRRLARVDLAVVAAPVLAVDGAVPAAVAVVVAVAVVLAVPAPLLAVAEAVLGRRADAVRLGRTRVRKAPISVVFRSFRLIFGRAIISRSALEALVLCPKRARAAHSR